MRLQSRHYWGIGAVAVLTIAGGYWWYTRSMVCCEPPLEIIEQQVAVNNQETWVGHWDYYVADDQGFTQGVVLRLAVEGGVIAGDFDAVWSFPGAPAARLNNGTLRATSVKPDEIIVEWEGSRDDRGQVVLRLSADKQQLTWEGTLAAGSVDDGYALNGKRLFHRNQWVAWTPQEQTDFLQKIKDLLKKEGDNYTIQPGEDATIMVAGNYGVINAFVPNAPDEESGWVYLKKDGDEWGIVLGPKVRFSKAELDQADIPEVMRY